MVVAATYIEANGLRIYYGVHGEGEPLLLVHGGTATSQSWASHLPAFTEHFRVFAPDSRGHGRTDNLTGELGYRVKADDVAALVGALGLQRPLIPLPARPSLRAAAGCLHRPRHSGGHGHPHRGLAATR